MILTALLLPGSDPPLRSTWKGPACWCCGQPFATQEGIQLVQPNEHHVVPRACGGTDGPTVSLSSDHHELLHRVADAMLANRPWQHLVAGLRPESQNRVLYLSNVVVLATRATEKDANRRFLLTGELPPVIGNKLRQLSAYYGASQLKVIALLIEAEHARLSL
jgi:hypothetical protein